MPLRVPLMLGALAVVPAGAAHCCQPSTFTRDAFQYYYEGGGSDRVLVSTRRSREYLSIPRMARRLDVFADDDDPAAVAGEAVVVAMRLEHQDAATGNATAYDVNVAQRTCTCHGDTNLVRPSCIPIDAELAARSTRPVGWNTEAHSWVHVGGFPYNNFTTKYVTTAASGDDCRLADYWQLWESGFQPPYDARVSHISYSGFSTSVPSNTSLFDVPSYCPTVAECHASASSPST